MVVKAKIILNNFHKVKEIKIVHLQLIFCWNRTNYLQWNQIEDSQTGSPNGLRFPFLINLCKKNHT